MIRRLAAVMLILTVTLVLLALPAVLAEGEKIVRVGWYDTPFNYKDSFGRRTGYAYEYQRKIAAYTGWKYEYVEGTWPELLQMLKDGRIDLMSDVSYTDERANEMLFSKTPMGTEIYYLYVASDNPEITISDPGTLEGKKVGVTKGTIQFNLLRNWLDREGISVNLVELESSERESLKLLARGTLDAFVTLDIYGTSDMMPLWKIGSSDFYFALSLNRSDLLTELDVALNRIQDENKFYSQKLSEKYLSTDGTAPYLSVEEKAWLEEHGAIRVGYQDHYLAFCAQDPKTGELTGALHEYLELAAGTLKNAEPKFEAVCFPTAAEAMEALKNGEIDCMFPANLTDYDGEAAGVVMTAPLMRTEMDAVVRAKEQREFLRHNQVRVGVNRGNPNYEMFLLEHFPNWTPVYYSDTPACLDAVAARAADCVIISNYRFRDIADQCRRLNLTTVYTSVDMDYCLAVREGSTVLYSILAKMIRQVPESAVNAALTYYSTRTESGFLNNSVTLVLTVACVLLTCTVVVLLMKLKKNNKPHR